MEKLSTYSEGRSSQDILVQATPRTSVLNVFKSVVDANILIRGLRCNESMKLCYLSRAMNNSVTLSPCQCPWASCVNRQYSHQHLILQQCLSQPQVDLPSFLSSTLYCPIRNTPCPHPPKSLRCRPPPNAHSPVENARPAQVCFARILECTQGSRSNCSQYPASA